MILDFKQFEKAAPEVERIIFLEGETNLRNELIQSANDIEDPRAKREYYRHMNTLFLNVLLNRLNQVGLDKESRVLEVRRILVELINS
jgi:hypothetical protein